MENTDQKIGDELTDSLTEMVLIFATEMTRVERTTANLAPKLIRQSIRIELGMLKR